MITLAQIAQACGGVVAGRQALVPGPGHSPADRSLSITLNAAGDDILVKSFADDDPLVCKDFAREKIGLEAWKPRKGRALNGHSNGHDVDGRPALPVTYGARKLVAQYGYRDLDGVLRYQVQRWEPKGFTQRRPNGLGGWITTGVFEGVTRVPYRWPDFAVFPSATLYVCEGEQDANNVAAIGLLSTTVAGGVWTAEIVAIFKDREVIICEDNDAAGRTKAAKAAAALAGTAKSIRIVTFRDLPEKGDVSDWIGLDPARHGADALRERALKAPLWQPERSTIEPDEGVSSFDNVPSKARPAIATPKATGWRDRFKLTAIADITPDSDPLWLVDGLIPAGPSLGVFFGKPKSGKTFLTTGMFLKVAVGKPYCDCAVQQGGVVYITKEGVKGFKYRMLALRQHGAAGHGVPFFAAFEMPNFGTACGDADALVALIRAEMPAGTPVAAVIIDTLARTMPGQSDSDGAAMSMFVENCEAVARAFGCFVGAVHHSPRGDDTRSRGSNVLDGAADVIISVVKDDATGISTATIEAAKDGEEGAQWRFHLIQIGIEVGHDRNKTGLFRPTAETIGTVTRKADTETDRNKKRTPSQQRFLDILAEAIIDVGALVPGSIIVPSGIKAVSRDQLKKCLLERGFLDRDKPDAARSIFSRALNDLAGKYIIGTTAEHVWLPK